MSYKTTYRADQDIIDLYVRGAAAFYNSPSHP